MKKQHDFIKAAAAVVFSIGLFSAAFVGVNNLTFAAAANKTESIPPVVTAVNIPAPETAPEGYQTPVFMVYEAPNGQHTASPNALSPADAAELGARYIWDMFGESIDGKTVAMTYHAWPSHTRAYWSGMVADSKEAAEDYDAQYLFNLCAVSGERIDITRMNRSDSGQDRRNPKVREALDALLRDKGRAEEAQRLLTGEPPAQLDEYEKTAKDYAAKHFVGTEVESVKLERVGSSGFDFDENGNLFAVTHAMSFTVTDSAGREAEVYIGMETKELYHVHTQHNDIVPGYNADVPGAVG